MTRLLKTRFSGFTVQRQKQSLIAFVMRLGVRLRARIRKQRRRISEMQNMEREVLLRQLVQAEQAVAESMAFIAQQQRVVVELRARRP